MATQIQLRQGTTTEHNTFTGAVGEVTYDTNKKQLRVHDGITVGGKIVDDPTRDVTSQVSTSTETVAGKAKIATTAIAQAGTNDTDIITAKKMRDALNATGGAPIFACRAWVDFSAQGGASINSSGNISSVIRNSNGDYTLNFLKAMPSNSYALFGMCSETLASAADPLIVTLRTTNGNPTLKTSLAVRISVKSPYTGNLSDTPFVFIGVVC